MIGSVCNFTSADIRMRWSILKKLKQSDRNGSEQSGPFLETGAIMSRFFQFARHGRALMGASPEHAQVVGNV